jgi:two-component system sensor histidine kinase PilS (NtrC family)
MLFRVVMVTTLLFIATYVAAVYESLLGVNPIYFVVGVTYALTVVHAVLLLLFPGMRALAYAQVAGDLLIVTALVHFTGPVRTGFVLLYPLSVLSATVLLSRRSALTLAGLATVLYGALLLAVREGVVESPGLADVQDQHARALVYSVFILGVACATVAVLGSYLAEGLQHAGARLREAAVEVADSASSPVIVSSIQAASTTDAEGRTLT